MKTRIVFAALLLGAVLLCGCRKDTSGKIIGSYSYKISGTVTVIETYDEVEDTLVRKLLPEQGQMHIVSDRGEEGRVKVTFDDLFGDACVTGARIDGHSIVLDPLAEKSISIQEDVLTRSVTVNFTGSGEKFDNMLIIDMDYAADEITECSVQCIAQYND